MIDNYDSFTYNLVQYLGELGADVTVFRNDEITVDEDRGAARPRTSSSRPARARRTRPASRSRLIERARRPRADPRRVPRPPGDRPGVRRQGGAREAGDARQDLAHPPRRARACSQRIRRPFRGDALPLAGGRARVSCPACLEVTRRVRGRRDHGPAPPQPARSRACSSIPKRCSPSTATSCCRISSREKRTMKQITVAEAIQRTVEHREVFHDEMLHIMRQIMRGELTPGADRRLHHRPAREEGDHRRDRRRGAGDARARDARSR